MIYVSEYMHTPISIKYDPFAVHIDMDNLLFGKSCRCSQEPCKEPRRLCRFTLSSMICSSWNTSQTTFMCNNFAALSCCQSSIMGDSWSKTNCDRYISHTRVLFCIEIISDSRNYNETHLSTYIKKTTELKNQTTCQIIVIRTCICTKTSLRLAEDLRMMFQVQNCTGFQIISLYYFCKLIRLSFNSKIPNTFRRIVVEINYIVIHISTTEPLLAHHCLAMRYVSPKFTERTFLHDRSWISPWIKSLSNELDITIHVITSQWSGHCDVINNRL